MMNPFYLIAFICLINPNLVVGDEEENSTAIIDNCKWIHEEQSSIHELGAHRVLILEDCLYYKLKDDYQEKHKDIRLAIRRIAPVQKGRIQVKLLDTQLTKIYMSRIGERAFLSFYMKISWKDSRLTWSVSEWKDADKLRIKSQHDIWTPSITDDDSRNGRFAYVQLSDLTVTPTGNVTGLSSLNYGEAHCETEYTKYPQHEKYCCLNLFENKEPDLVQFSITNKYGEVHRDDLKDIVHKRGDWEVASLETTIDHKKEKQTMRVCVRAKKGSKTMEMALYLPVAICAVVFLISPLVGKMQKQLMVKLFAILLQFMCFHLLADLTPTTFSLRRYSLASAGEVHSETTPLIYTFYEFTLTMTMCSLLFSLLFHGLSQKNYKFPPNHRLSLIANTINRYLFCCVGKIEENISDDNVNYEYYKIYSAANAAVSLFLAFVYIFACIVFLCMK